MINPKNIIENFTPVKQNTNIDKFTGKKNDEVDYADEIIDIDHEEVNDDSFGLELMTVDDAEKEKVYDKLNIDKDSKDDTKEKNVTKNNPCDISDNLYQKVVNKLNDSTSTSINISSKEYVNTLTTTKGLSNSNILKPLFSNSIYKNLVKNNAYLLNDLIYNSVNKHNLYILDTFRKNCNVDDNEIKKLVSGLNNNIIKIIMFNNVITKMFSKIPDTGIQDEIMDKITNSINKHIPGNDKLIKYRDNKEEINSDKYIGTVIVNNVNYDNVKLIEITDNDGNSNSYKMDYFDKPESKKVFDINEYIKIKITYDTGVKDNEVKEFQNDKVTINNIKRIESEKSYIGKNKIKFYKTENKDDNIVETMLTGKIISLTTSKNTTTNPENIDFKVLKNKSIDVEGVIDVKGTKYKFIKPEGETIDNAIITPVNRVKENVKYTFKKDNLKPGKDLDSENDGDNNSYDEREVINIEKLKNRVKNYGKYITSAYRLKNDLNEQEYNKLVDKYNLYYSYFIKTTLYNLKGLVNRIDSNIRSNVEENDNFKGEMNKQFGVRYLTLLNTFIKNKVKKIEK